jgi:transposase
MVTLTESKGATIMAGLARIFTPVLMAAGLALSGCASLGIEAPARVAAATPAAVPPMPTLPPGLPQTMNVPPTDAAGAYLTLNHNVDEAQAVWHMRSALNVAALSCRGGTREAAIIAAYNAMLKVQKAPLAKALRLTETRFKAERGKTWQADYDSHMTRVYNFFAQPAAQGRFCEVSAEIIAEGGAGVPADFPAVAAAALPRLEAPFTDAYRAFDGYRRELAAWQARYGTAAVTGLSARDMPMRTAAR